MKQDESLVILQRLYSFLNKMFRHVRVECANLLKRNKMVIKSDSGSDLDDGEKL